MSYDVDLPRSRSLSVIARSTLDTWRLQKSASASSLPTYFTKYQPLSKYSCRDNYEYSWDRRFLWGPTYRPYYGYTKNYYVSFTPSPSYYWWDGYTPRLPSRCFYPADTDPLTWRRECKISEIFNKIYDYLANQL